MDLTVIKAGYESFQPGEDDVPDNDVFSSFEQHPNAINDLMRDILKPLGVGSEYCIAGGSIISYLNGNGANDVDVFFKNDEDFKKMSRHLFETMGAAHYYETDFSLGLVLGDVVYDLIKVRKADDPVAVIEGFDFICCKFAYDYRNNVFYYHHKAPDQLRDKLIEIDWDSASLQKPYRTIDRIVKYSGRGFKIGREELRKVSRLLNAFDGEVPDVSQGGSGG